MQTVSLPQRAWTSQQFCFVLHKINRDTPRVVIDKHDEISTSTDQFHLKWSTHITMNNFELIFRLMMRQRFNCIFPSTHLSQNDNFEVVHSLIPDARSQSTRVLSCLFKLPNCWCHRSTSDKSSDTTVSHFMVLLSTRKPIPSRVLLGPLIQHLDWSNLTFFTAALTENKLQANFGTCNAS